MVDIYIYRFYMTMETLIVDCVEGLQALSTKGAPEGLNVIAEVEGLRLGPSGREETAHLTRLTQINLPCSSTPAILPHV